MANKKRIIYVDYLYTEYAILDKKKYDIRLINQD